MLLVRGVGLVVTMGVLTPFAATEPHAVMSSSPTIGSACIPLIEVFATVPDTRARRGVRHDLAVVLALAAAAVLSGSRSLLSMGEWVLDADREALSRLGIGPGVGLPSESTIRRTLAAVNADCLDRLIGVWMATRVRTVEGRRVIAVDGRSLRGATRDGAMPHLLAALDHDAGIVVAQRAVPDKGSEIPAIKELLGAIDLAGAVITADALHCQRDTASWLVEIGAGYVLTVKDNQPTLRAKLKDLPWSQVPGHTYRDKGHGRRVTRTLKAVVVPAWVDWPGAAQVLLLRQPMTRMGRARP